MIGRPYLFGLAAGGEAGVDLVLRWFEEGIRRNLALVGCARLDDLTSEFVAWRVR
jgi:isopentenyl diphosphate isomerase/L-lactate dehydrogenase-like FMN-dependent dehydrogenase